MDHTLQVFNVDLTSAANRVIFNGTQKTLRLGSGGKLVGAVRANFLPGRDSFLLRADRLVFYIGYTCQH